MTIAALSLESGTLIVPLGFAAALAAALAVYVVARRLRAAVRARGQAADAADGGQRVPSPSGATGDAYLPRWRRPSVAAARFETLNGAPDRSAPPPPLATPRVPRVFSQPVDKAADLMVVRYDGVPLLDRPEEALGKPLADLDSGDEVVVLDGNDLWASVSTPMAVAGWVPRMALAPASFAASLAEPDGDVTVEPQSLMIDDGPPLEFLLAAIAAERRGRETAQPAPAGQDATGRRKRPPARKPGAENPPKASPKPRSPSGSRAQPT